MTNTRPVNDIWWEGDDMLIEFADTLEICRFKGAYATSYQPREAVPHNGDFIELLPLTFKDIKT